MENRNILIHTHIFKNAGSSFDDALERNFGNSFIDHRDDHLIHKDKNFLNRYIDENPNVKAFSSHSIYDKPTSFENVQYHTCYFVRHPIDRIKSVYSFEHKQPAEDSLGAKMAKELDFKEYVNWRMTPEAPPTIRNLQTVFVAGMGKGTGRMEIRYELALKTLEKSALIALVDRYDESMVVFEEYLCEFFPDIDLSYIRRNVTDKVQTLSPEEKAQKLLNDLDEELSEKVIENNKYDIELYNKANNTLDKKIKNIEKFQEKLANFQQRCSQLKERGKVDIKPLYKSIKETIINSIGRKEKDLKKKKNIILHIGRHKSGTSSLQKFLCDNEKVLKEKGFYYPKSLRRKIAHHPLAYFYNDNLKSNLSSDDINEIKEFWEEIEDKNNIIISSEAFQNINPNNLKKDFENYNLTIVVYLRDQVSYLLSSYAQAIQNQKSTKTLEEYESTNFKDIDYLKFLNKWESALPSAKLIVRLFDKKNLHNEDIREDFIINCNICNKLELNNFNFENKDQNPSIGGALLEFKRLLNYTDFDKYIKTNKIYEILGKLALGNEKYKLQKLIKKDIYDKVITKYEESNQRVSKLYLSGQNIIMQKVHFSNLNLMLTSIEKSKILKLFSGFGINLNSFKIETNNYISESTPGLEKFFFNQNNKYNKILKLFKTESNNYTCNINIINDLLNSDSTYEELIALSTVTKMFFRKDRNFKETLNRISKKLTLLRIPNINKSDSIDINHITLMSSTVRTDGEHIKIIYGFLISLLSSDFQGKISLILTSEMEWFTWRRINYNDMISKYEVLFKDLIESSSIKEKSDILNSFKNKVQIVIAPRLEEINDYLGEVVLRFIGHAAFRTTFVSSKHIYENKTVITVPYSSTIDTMLYTDLLLTRHNKSSQKMLHYNPPLLLPNIKIKTNNIKDNSDEINIVTVYSQNRIQLGIQNFKNKDWIRLKDLFQKNKKLKWIFIGAEDINKVYNCIPKEILDLERIEVYGYRNLQEIYKENSFFLALPNIPGGGGGALLAILSKVPVFAHNNNKSDISSLVSDEFLFNDLETQINQIEFCIENKEKVNEIKQKQFNFINLMSNMRKKGQELYLIINETHSIKGTL